MNKVIKGKTHCDNIGDCFRNRFIIRFIKEWNNIKNDEKLLIWSEKSRSKTWNKKKFSPEFYEFIRSIFENRSSMNDFLDYIREQILSNSKLKSNIDKEFGVNDLVKIILAFDELNDQLSTIEKLTVWSVFKTRISEIVWAANTRPSHFQDEEEQEVDYSLTQLQWLRGAIVNWVMPISSRWEILLYIDHDKWRYMMSKLGNSEIVYVDKNWNRLDQNNELITIKTEKRLDSREDVMRSLLVFEQVYDYHISGCQKDISKDAEIMHENLVDEFATQEKISIQDVFATQENLTKFKRWMIQEYNKLKDLLKSDTLKRDTTRIDEWSARNITTHKPYSDLPTHDMWQKKPKKKWTPKLRVVKKQ